MPAKQTDLPLNRGKRQKAWDPSMRLRNSQSYGRSPEEEVQRTPALPAGRDGAPYTFAYRVVRHMQGLPTTMERTIPDSAIHRQSGIRPHYFPVAGACGECDRLVRRDRETANGPGKRGVSGEFGSQRGCSRDFPARKRPDGGSNRAASTREFRLFVIHS